ncbi:MAG: DNA adenine methylase [Planctomycetota bacterium]
MTANQVTQTCFPPTRYQGSKRKLLDWIWENVRDLRFCTVLDAFGGTGAVAHLFKQHGKQVTYNDVLKFNYLIGTALIENRRRRLTETDMERIITPDPSAEYDDFIARTFADIYFTDEENHWLDMVVQNIAGLRHRHRRAVACCALFQSCLAKRPYNLFHRKNLYMRTADVARSFGNKATWDRSFAEHFRHHARQTNDAIFDSGQPCRALNLDAAEVPGHFDLVYIDPPYVSARNVGVDYHGFYHFLEGLTDYRRWPKRIDYESKHRRLKPVANPWTNAGTNAEAFRDLFHRYADSILVVSYRSDGCPDVDRLRELLSEVKSTVGVAALERYQYALSRNRSSREVVLVGL